MASNGFSVTGVSEPNGGAGGYAAGVIPAVVVYDGRSLGKSKRDLTCLVLFVIGLVAYIACGIFVVANRTVSLGSLDIEGELLDEFNACVSNFNSGRLLQSDFATCNTWCIFGRAPHVPVLTILMVPAVAVLWLVGLYFSTRAVVWTSVIGNAVLYIILGVALASEDSGAEEVAYLFIALGVFFLLFLAYTRNQVVMAIRHMKTAVGALSSNKDVFVAGGVLEVMVLGVLGLHWYFTLAANQNFIVEDVTCNLVVNPVAVKMTVFMVFMLVWILAFFQSAQLITTSMSIGAYFFDQEEKHTAFRSLKVSLTSSLGVNAFGSLITAIVEALIREATDPLWWTSPTSCVARCIFLCLESLIRAYTRFATISHAFTGEPFVESGTRVFQVLKRNFVGGYVLSRVGVSVVNIATKGLSLCIGLLAWHLLDKEEGINSLGSVVETFGSLFGTVAFLISFLYLISKPVLTIALITFIIPLLESFNAGVGVFVAFGGVFVACISAIILRFVGTIVINALDTIFIAYAIGKEGNLDNNQMAKVYTIMQDLDEYNEKERAGSVPVAMPVTSA